jgi:hypothetical protein
MWILLVCNALVLAALLVTVWRLQQAKLRTHMASLSAEERPTHPSLGRQRLALLEHRHRQTVSQRSALDEFPSEENSLEPLRRLS